MDEIVIESRHYVSSRRAAEEIGFSQAYVTHLAREGILDARMIGGLWFISREALELHKAQATTRSDVPDSVRTEAEAFPSVRGARHYVYEKDEGDLMPTTHHVESPKHVEHHKIAESPKHVEHHKKESSKTRAAWTNWDNALPAT